MKGAKSKAATTKKAEPKLAVKSKGAAKATKKPTKKEKAPKDPNKPKRPPSAFFVFMEGFRKTYKEKHPDNKSVALVGKAGGEKWKSLSETEKAPYVAKAEKRKIEYTKSMDAYNNKLAAEADGAGSEDGSDKSKSEVNDEDNDEESGEEGDDE